MRLVLLSFLGLVALAAASPATFQYPNIQNYHQEVGIKNAEYIRGVETKIFDNPLLRNKNLLQDGRIVGGVAAPVSAYPFLGGLIVDLVGVAGNSVCGSSLISVNRAVTAAHCWQDGANQAWRFTVVLGSQYLFFGGGLRLATSDVIMHPQWNRLTLANDIAMIYLPTNVPFSSDIHPIVLPTGNDLFDDFTGNWALAAGYGRTSDQLGLSTSTLVSHVALQVITNQQCEASFSSFVQASNICTSGVGGVGICGGDSGGPLTVVKNGQNILVGISSFVASAGCQLGHPSAFARVTSFLDFIQLHL